MSIGRRLTKLEASNRLAKSEPEPETEDSRVKWFLSAYERYRDGDVGRSKNYTKAEHADTFGCLLKVLGIDA